MPQASLEHALRTLITGLSAFAAITPAPAVRPYKLSQADFKAGTSPLGVIISSQEEEHQVSLEGLGGGVSAKASVYAVAETFEAAWSLAETIRLNGTNPGTGLAGFKGTVAGLAIQMISVDKTTKGFIAYEDGGDEGYYSVARHLTVDFTESN